jgi:hypothetical protein
MLPYQYFSNFNMVVFVDTIFVYIESKDTARQLGFEFYC